MIGNELADALALPYHPTPWGRMKIYLRSTLVFGMIRLYTLASMYIPFVRRWTIRWHAKQLVKFHQKWMKTHKSKMAKALARNETASILDDETNDEMDDDDDDTNSNHHPAAAVASICPFAMIAKPSS